MDTDALMAAASIYLNDAPGAKRACIALRMSMLVLMHTDEFSAPTRFSELLVLISRSISVMLEGIGDEGMDHLQQTAEEIQANVKELHELVGGPVDDVCAYHVRAGNG
jgi:hypothetical protein